MSFKVDFFRQVEWEWEGRPDADAWQFEAERRWKILQDCADYIDQYLQGMIRVDYRFGEEPVQFSRLIFRYQNIGPGTCVVLEHQEHPNKKWFYPNGIFRKVHVLPNNWLVRVVG